MFCLPWLLTHTVTHHPLIKLDSVCNETYMCNQHVKIESCYSCIDSLNKEIYLVIYLGSLSLLNDHNIKIALPKTSCVYLHVQTFL